MTYKVDLSKQRAVVIAPTNLERGSITKHLDGLSTPLGSAPLAATVGIAMDDLDEPINIVKAKLSARILTAIATLEPMQLSQISILKNFF
ncbi:lysozyme [Paenibacillus larvae]|nr:lysozyme [Paenibacillus larvae]MDT2243187.1 lysozyme [Paenibacillus larvae]